MQATSPNTPTVVSSHVASVMAIRLRLAPILLMMDSAMRSAAPLSMSAPARIPAVTMRMIAETMPCVPEMIKLTVPVSPAPPTRPPITAPKIMA